MRILRFLKAMMNYNTFAILVGIGVFVYDSVQLIRIVNDPILGILGCIIAAFTALLVVGMMYLIQAGILAAWEYIVEIWDRSI